MEGSSITVFVQGVLFGEVFAQQVVDPARAHGPGPMGPDGADRSVLSRHYRRTSGEIYDIKENSKIPKQ